MRPSGGATRGRDEDGAVIVEFAAIFVVFAMLLWGIISYGMVFAVQQTLSHAAAEATRGTVGLSDEDAAIANAQMLLDEQLSWLPPAGVASNVDVDECPGGESERCTSVVVTYHWGEHPIVPSILNAASPDMITGRAVVQFK